MNDEMKVEIESLRTEYREVCQNHRAVTDFRGKLLTLLPLASGTGIYLLIPKGNPNDLAPAYFLAIGLFGVLVTLGLFLHEIRGIKECGDLIKVGRSLEEMMGLTDGQFIREDEYYHCQTKRLKKLSHKYIGPIGAGRIIYLSMIVAWLFVAAIGVTRLLGLFQ